MSSFKHPSAWRPARAALLIGPLQVCDQEQLQEVVEKALGCGPNFKYYFRDGSYHGVPHQYNCTYFSAVGSKPQDYLLARAIQFFTPGMPMVYYNGLLAGTNDFRVRLSLVAQPPGWVRCCKAGAGWLSERAQDMSPLHIRVACPAQLAGARSKFCLLAADGVHGQRPRHQPAPLLPGGGRHGPREARGEGPHRPVPLP